MASAELQIAEYFAELANLPNVGQRTPAERRRLAIGMLRIPEVRIAVADHWRDTNEQDADVALRYLDVLHTHIRKTLPRLLAGVPVLMPWTAQGHPASYRLIRGRVYADVDPSDRALAVFTKLCLRPRFPFGQCSACGKIFARVKRQRHCSTECRNKAYSAAQKDGRREYMRQYMANRRAKAHKAARKKGR